jgi:hypothetical protein
VDLGEGDAEGSARKTFSFRAGIDFAMFGKIDGRLQYMWIDDSRDGNGYGIGVLVTLLQVTVQYRGEHGK